ncbi:hypothetical protein K440DRAFT_9874 [Wilcoxina mikolae CBS 423.85]|nr:hypothetical protein K440DRAFT_9874 [Wilcoxina mikolae CBS 423.85]
MWLRNCLPQDLPEVRVFTFGYESRLRSSTSDSSFADFGRQLLDAVHSVRQDGHEETTRSSSENDQAVLKLCIGIFPFGVPNRGLNEQNLMTLVRGQKNETLIRDLGQTSQLLREMERAFQHGLHTEHCSIVSFYESKDTKTVEVKPTGELTRTGPFIQLVNRGSATCFCPTAALQDHIPIDTDHSSLVKFTGRSDKHYDAVRIRLSSLVKRATNIMRKRGKTCPAGDFEAIF